MKFTQPQVDMYRAEDYLIEILDTARRRGIRQYSGFGSTLNLPDEQFFDNIDQAQAYVDQLLMSPQAFSYKAPPLRIRIVAGRYSNIATMSGSTMSLPDNSTFLRELRVLHEVAHYLSDSYGHSDRFRDVYRDLIELQLGDELAFLLDVFLRTGV